MKTLNAWGRWIDALLTRMQDMSQEKKRLVDGLCYCGIAVELVAIVWAGIVMLSRVAK